MTKLVYAPKIRGFYGFFYISPVCVEFVNDFAYRRIAHIYGPISEVRRTLTYTVIGACAYMRGIR